MNTPETTPRTTGVIICDHGSRRQASNDSLKEVAKLFAERFADDCDIVEPAHMELAMPDIAAAYGSCVERGANHIVILPFFLARGKHWTRDIPSLTSQAAAEFPGTTYQVAEPLGIDTLILDLLKKRLDADDQPTLASGEEDPRLKDTPATDKRIQCNTCPFQLDKETGVVTIKEGSGVVAAGIRH
ncbi:CbiX/SirB N-terminal domain-containing protein [Algisphaera agarilytica]|uniref:Sirohydrochlorin ferrochelatase n=1 Tax=Algisphaera agarilytica TaxID=1385975 RepID=A0A7X0LL78_9BACT|nr:CbiX/SirB N-terminal domain-containing protein [Algisphaera agarilytica]MBB6430727.1 sirohydrochlorin ferrochelatase [Algisphaera agarilytica]